MAKIAIMGFGTVGSGVFEVIRTNSAGVARRAAQPVEVKYILDVRDFSAHPHAELFVKDINIICGVKIFCNTCLICDDDCEISFFLQVCNCFVCTGQKIKIFGAVKMTGVAVYCSVSVKKNSFSDSF